MRQGLTSREQLEESAQKLHDLTHKIDAKGGAISDADQKALDDGVREVHVLKARHESRNAIEPLAAPAGPMLGNLGYPPGAGGFGQKQSFEIGDDGAIREIGEYRGPADIGSAPSLAFSDGDLQDLHKAVTRRELCRKTVTSTNAPMAAVGNYSLNVFPFLRDKTRLLDYIPTTPTTFPTENYFRATAAASAADSVAQGADKPESTPTWELVTAPVQKLAHYTRVNDEVIADFEGFVMVIGAEMISGLIDVETDQLLNGSGTPPDLRGLLTTTGILTRSKGADSYLDCLFKATNDLRAGDAFTEPDVIVLNPADWSVAALQKSSAGEYLTQLPSDPGPARLWNTPVVVTTRIASGTGMVANLKLAAEVKMRQTPTMEVHPYGGGAAEFIANQTLIRAEERLALKVQRPKAIVKINFAA